jgi:hypothetical protein
MKRLQILVLAGVMLLGISACSVTADDVVSKNISANGGEDAWKNVQSIRATGTLHTPGDSILLTMTAVHGKAFRTDYSIRGMHGYSIITPTEGWYVNPGDTQSAPHTMAADRLKESQNELDLHGKLIDYKAKGNQVSYKGKEQMGGMECYKLHLKLKSGNDETWYINTATNYVVKTIARKSIGGKMMLDTVAYSNYKQLPEGIVYPMTLSTRNGDIVFSSVEVNTPVDERIFKP